MNDNTTPTREDIEQAMFLLITQTLAVCRS